MRVMTVAGSVPLGQWRCSWIVRHVSASESAIVITSPVAAEWRKGEHREREFDPAAFRPSEWNFSFASTFCAFRGGGAR